MLNWCNWWLYQSSSKWVASQVWLLLVQYVVMLVTVVSYMWSLRILSLCTTNDLAVVLAVWVNSFYTCDVWVLVLSVVTLFPRGVSWSVVSRWSVWLTCGDVITVFSRSGGICGRIFLCSIICYCTVVFVVIESRSCNCAVSISCGDGCLTAGTSVRWAGRWCKKVWKPLSCTLLVIISISIGFG